MRLLEGHLRAWHKLQLPVTPTRAKAEYQVPSMYPPAQPPSSLTPFPPPLPFGRASTKSTSASRDPDIVHYPPRIRTGKEDVPANINWEQVPSAAVRDFFNPLRAQPPLSQLVRKGRH